MCRVPCATSTMQDVSALDGPPARSFWRTTRDWREHVNWNSICARSWNTFRCSSLGSQTISAALADESGGHGTPNQPLSAAIAPRHIARHQAASLVAAHSVAYRPPARVERLYHSCHGHGPSGMMMLEASAGSRPSTKTL